MSEIIRLENVVRLAPNGYRAVDDVSFIVHEHEHVQIYGAPGSGKSMLMRLIAGMDLPDVGQVFIAGSAVHEMNKEESSVFRNRMIGICLRTPSPMPSLTVWENVALPLAIRGTNVVRRKKVAMKQLEAFGLSYAAHANPLLLSAYELQLASLARAMAAEPPILLLYDIVADLPEKEAKRVASILYASSHFSDATVIDFVSKEFKIPAAGRRFTLDYGKITEVNP